VIKEFDVFKSWNIKQKTVKAYEKSQDSLPKNQRDGFLKYFIIKKNIELNSYPNPIEKLNETILHNIPKMMFVLLPLFALILKLTYFNRRKYYYEHLVYSFHLHSAIFISILLTMLLNWILSFLVDIKSILVVICIIYLTWYIYRSLKIFYGGSRLTTLFKIILLGFIYFFLLALSLIAISAVSFVMI
jgi:hypothetical protein